MTQWAVRCHLVGKPSSQPLGSPSICTTPQSLSSFTALPCAPMYCSGGRAVQLFLSVAPRRGVTVWGNHSLSPSHTFSLFLSSKGLFLRPALPAWESLELQCVRFHRLGLNHSVCHHPAISNILLFSQQCSDSLTCVFSIWIWWAAEQVLRDTHNNGKKSYNSD